MPAQDRTPSTAAEGSAFHKPVFPELPLDIVTDSAVPEPTAKPHRNRTDDKANTPEPRKVRGAGKADRNQSAHHTRRYAFRRS